MPGRLLSSIDDTWVYSVFERAGPHTLAGKSIRILEVPNAPSNINAFAY